MWTCSKCDRIFQRVGQQHSCRKVTLESHFENKDLAKELFDHLLARIKREVGSVKIISLPCCVHLFGAYDFLAALPKKDGLEVRIALARKVKSSRLVQSVPLSKTTFKNCFFVTQSEEIDKELLDWVKESYYLKDK